MAIDNRKTAIVIATTTAIGAWDASNFADALLKHENLLMPKNSKPMSVAEQVSSLTRNATHLQKIAKLWEANNGVTDGFANALRNPATLAKFQEIAAKDGEDGIMDQTTALFQKYAQSGSSELQKSIDIQHRRLYPEKYQARPATTTNSPATSTTNKQSTPSAPARPATPHKAPATTPSPIAAAATTPSTPAAAATSPPAAAQPGIKRFDADGANVLTQTLAAQVADMYKQADGQSPFDADIKTLQERLNHPTTGPILRQQIADAINSDPELLKQLNTDGGDNLFGDYDKLSPEAKEKVRKALEGPIRDLINNPAKIGNKEFRTSMTSAGENSIDMKDKMGMMIDKFTSMLGLDPKTADMIKQFAGGFLGNLMEMGTKLFAAGGEMFSSGNLAVMKNGASNLLGNFTESLGMKQTASIEHVAPGNGSTSPDDPHLAATARLAEQEKLSRNLQSQPAAQQAGIAGAPLPAGGNPAPPATVI